MADKRLLPPLRRPVERGVLARGDEVQPNHCIGLINKESFERPHEIQKLDLPRVAYEPRRGLNARITLLPQLSAQGQS